MTDMVERGGVRVDWFEGRGGGREGMDEAMEVDARRGGGGRGREEWGRNGEEDPDEEDADEEARRKKARRGMLAMRGKDEQEKEAEDAEDNMLELRLSLAVAISVPSAPPKQELEHQQQQQQQSSFVVHPHQNSLSLRSHNGDHNQHQHHQLQQHHEQLGAALGGLTQSPVKPLMQMPASPIETERDSSRANLGATLKHLVSQQLQQQQQQQPVKVKSMPRIPGLASGTARQAIQPQYGVSPLPQLHRSLLPPLVRSSPASQHGLDNGAVQFQGMGRLNPSAAQAAAPSQACSFALAQSGKRQQSAHHLVDQAHESLFQKGFLQQSQPRLPAHFSRATTAALPQQPGKELLTHQGQQLGGSIGHCTVLASSPSSRIFATNSYSPQIAAHAVQLPGTGPQLQALLQHQSSSSVSVASHRQKQQLCQGGTSTPGLNPSAFSVVRPAISGTVPSSAGDNSPRERSGGVHVIVNVCDRKVKLTSEVDPTSLYAICRRWVRNDVVRRDQPMFWDGPPLPRPLPAAKPGSSKAQSTENRMEEEAASPTQVDLPRSVESMTHEEVLIHHVGHFKNVRKRFGDNRMHRIARFMPRLALLLPLNSETTRRDAVQSHPCRGTY